MNFEKQKLSQKSLSLSSLTLHNLVQNMPRNKSTNGGPSNKEIFSPLAKGVNMSIKMTGLMSPFSSNTIKLVSK